MELNISIIDQKSLESDLNDFMAKVKPAITAGLNAVGSDMKASLKSHIMRDVYGKYTPRDYIRRGEDGGMADEANMEATAKDDTLTFIYRFPTSPSRWRNSKEHAEYEDGDDSIRAIQTGLGYPTIGELTEDGMLVRRPFWSYFVDDFVGCGQAEVSLVAGMNAYDRSLQAVSENKRIQVDTSDMEEEPNYEAPIRAHRV